MGNTHKQRYIDYMYILTYDFSMSILLYLP